MEDTFERVALLTQKLISFPTVTQDNEVLKSCVKWVQNYALEQNPHIIVQEFISSGKPSILLSLGTAAPTFLFCGHLDVVEAHNQYMFTATMLDDSRMRGRGAADMKGPIAAMLDILLFEPLQGAGVLLTTDEESGGYDGANYVLKCIDWRPDIVILPDGGANMSLVTNQKGFLTLRIRAEREGPPSLNSWVTSPMKAIQDGYEALLRAYPPPKSEEDWHTSISMTQVEAKDLANSASGYAEAVLDIRFPANEGPAEHLVKDISRRLGRYNILVTILRQGPSFFLDKTSPIVTQFQEVAKNSIGSPLPYKLEAGGSDARFFALENVPVLVFQPECADVHGHNEWIDVHSLVTFRTLCYDFMAYFLNK